MVFTDEVANLWISSLDVVQCSLRQLDQLRVSHSMDSGGSWLPGQRLHLKYKEEQIKTLFKKKKS